MEAAYWVWRKDEGMEKLLLSSGKDNWFRQIWKIVSQQRNWEGNQIVSRAWVAVNTYRS
jgi:hypothetical protein